MNDGLVLVLGSFHSCLLLFRNNFFRNSYGNDTDRIIYSRQLKKIIRRNFSSFRILFLTISKNTRQIGRKMIDVSRIRSWERKLTCNVRTRMLR